MPDQLTLQSSTGSRLAALEWQGDPSRTFLLVHGLSSNARTWEGVAGTLTNTGARVVAVDQRSHGKSEVTVGGYDFTTLTDDLAGVIDQTNLGRPVVAGQSWGGNVVVEMAAHHPDLVAAVIGVDGGHIRLSDAFATWESCAETLAPPRLSGMSWVELEARLRATHPDWSDEGIAASLANFRSDENGGAQPNLPFDKHMLILRALYEHRPDEVAGALPMPTKLVAVRSSERPVRSGSGFDEVVLLDGDHDLHVQQPTLVAQLLQEMAPWA